MFRVFKKAWIPLLLVVVVALGAYAVVRIRNSLGANGSTTTAVGNGGDTKPFNPKHITYEVTGTGGTWTSTTSMRTGSLIAWTPLRCRGRSRS
ncbi:MAG: hypothetical protein QOI01_5555 [Mycobacterium sp.]|nr:hypothetical protein [Mycobacterium sp.]